MKPNETNSSTWTYSCDACTPGCSTCEFDSESCSQCADPNTAGANTAEWPTWTMNSGVQLCSKGEFRNPNDPSRCESCSDTRFTGSTSGCLDCTATQSSTTVDPANPDANIQLSCSSCFMGYDFTLVGVGSPENSCKANETFSCDPRENPAGKFHFQSLIFLS